MRLTYSILKDQLDLRKLSALWVPTFFREDQLAMKANVSLQTLNKWDANHDDFFAKNCDWRLNLVVPI